LFTMWSGRQIKGELAVSKNNALTLRHLGNGDTTTKKRNQFQECFIARKILYCVSPNAQNFSFIYDIETRNVIEHELEFPGDVNTISSLQYSHRDSNLYAWLTNGTVVIYYANYM